MHRSELPRLDLLRTFEAAARQRSFTRAADELALTQSAVSRQIQTLEHSVGVALFERRHRAIVLNDAGRVLLRAVDDALERLRDATARIRTLGGPRQVSITTTPGFASLWLIPRLARFTESHAGVDVRVSAVTQLLDLDRAGIDVAVRFVPIAKGRGQRLFEEAVLPVCAPSLLRDARRPLRSPADLVHHTLLAVEGPRDDTLVSDWSPWLAAMDLPDLKMRNTLRFSQYTEAVAAALAGHGVVLGRLPLLAGMIARRELVAPFRAGAASSQRGYFVEASSRQPGNADARDLVVWLLAEAAAHEPVPGGNSLEVATYGRARKPRPAP